MPRSSADVNDESKPGNLYVLGVARLSERHGATPSIALLPVANEPIGSAPRIKPVANLPQPAAITACRGSEPRARGSERTGETMFARRYLGCGGALACGALGGIIGFVIRNAGKPPADSRDVHGMFIGTVVGVILGAALGAVAFGRSRKGGKRKDG
jgi:hypothetical protein